MTNLEKAIRHEAYNQFQIGTKPELLDSIKNRDYEDFLIWSSPLETGEWLDQDYIKENFFDLIFPDGIKKLSTYEYEQELNYWTSEYIRLQNNHLKRFLGFKKTQELIKEAGFDEQANN